MTVVKKIRNPQESGFCGEGLQETDTTPKGTEIAPPHGKRQRVGREMESSFLSSVSLRGRQNSRSEPVGAPSWPSCAVGTRVTSGQLFSSLS